MNVSSSSSSSIPQGNFVILPTKKRSAGEEVDLSARKRIPTLEEIDKKVMRRIPKICREVDHKMLKDKVTSLETQLDEVKGEVAELKALIQRPIVLTTRVTSAFIRSTSPVRGDT